jgi:ABC-type transporter Mla maintaining outer membrane lipid asymmetry ATPase subunit MlaF
MATSLALHDTSVPISLNFKDIGISIANRQILQGVGGKVKPGQILAIMGPSGELLLGELLHT